MESTFIHSALSFRPSQRTNSQNPKSNLSWRRRSLYRIGHVPPQKIHAIDGAVDLAPVEISWQIAIGALAGITPFIVAGIEFGKRIIAQRKCEVCGGSGLILKDEYCTRCPNCGGFLPWQSWKRFFKGAEDHALSPL